MEDDRVLVGNLLQVEEVEQFDSALGRVDQTCGNHSACLLNIAYFHFKVASLSADFQKEGQPSPYLPNNSLVLWVDLGNIMTAPGSFLTVANSMIFTAMSLFT